MEAPLCRHPARWGTCFCDVQCLLRSRRLEVRKPLPHFKRWLAALQNPSVEHQEARVFLCQPSQGIFARKICGSVLSLSWSRWPLTAPYLQRFLQEHGEVQLSALGLGDRLGQRGMIAATHAWSKCCLCTAAISSMVTVAEILKSNKLASEQSKPVAGAQKYNVCFACNHCLTYFRNFHWPGCLQRWWKGASRAETKDGDRSSQVWRL